MKLNIIPVVQFNPFFVCSVFLLVWKFIESHHLIHIFHNHIHLIFINSLPFLNGFWLKLVMKPPDFQNQLNFQLITIQNVRRRCWLNGPYSVANCWLQNESYKSCWLQLQNHPMYPTYSTSNKQYHIIKFYKTINFYSIASSAFFFS